MRPIWSNCWLIGLRIHLRRYRRWARAGYPKGRAPQLRIPPSRSKPHFVPHMQVWGHGPAIEFVPRERKDVPVWLVWTRLLFRGRLRRADFPHTEPSQHGDL